MQKHLLLSTVALTLHLYASSGLADESGLRFVTFEYANQPISSEFVDYVARYGARTPYEVIPDGELSTYVEALCQDASERNLDLFRKSLTLQGLDISGNGAIAVPAGATELLFPPCLPTPKTEKALNLAGPGATIWRYFDKAGREPGLGIRWGAGEARPTQIGDLDLLLASAVTDESVAGAAPAEGSIFAKYGLDWSRTCPGGLSAEGCLMGPYAGPGGYETLVSQALHKAADEAADPEALGAEAFLLGNELIQMGSDPDLTKWIIRNQLQAVPWAGDPGMVSTLGDTVATALDQYSVSGRGLTSAEWEALLAGDDPTRAASPDFQSQIDWLVPSNQARPGGAVQIADLILAPRAVSQPVRIPLDEAAAGVPPPPVSNAADAPSPEIRAQDSWPIFSADDYQCRSGRHHNWGDPGFASAFLHAVARSRVAAYATGKELKSIRIKVLDTGHVEAGDMGAFTDDVLAEKAPLRLAQKATPLMGRHFAHGMKVTGLALGGPALRNIVPALGFDIRIQNRKVYGHASARGSGPDASPTVTLHPDILSNAMREHADIINMSFTSTNIDMMSRRVAGNAGNKLLVVAAGNNHINNADAGADLGSNILYPQSWGGNPDWPNMLTVAALDGRKRAGFSNWSEEKVLIAAPGCGVGSWTPTLEAGSAAAGFREAPSTGPPSRRRSCPMSRRSSGHWLPATGTAPTTSP